MEYRHFFKKSAVERKDDDEIIDLSTPINTERRYFLNLNEYDRGDDEYEDGDGYDSYGNMGKFSQ